MTDHALTTPGEHTLVHVASRVTDAVFQFLGPTTSVLAEQGHRQTVILLDDPKHRHVLPRFHPSVRLSPERCEGGLVRNLRCLLQALRREVEAAPVSAVHLHGVFPCMLGAYAMRFQQPAPKIFFSPHGSNAFGPLKSAAGLALLAMRRGESGGQHAISHVGPEVRAMAVTRQQVALLESPVDAPFIDIERNEARRPLLAAGSHPSDPVGAARLAQLAVLLGEEELGISFNWIGALDAEGRARLKAADVATFDLPPPERAAKLNPAWIYLAPGEDYGFPHYLAEALAVGLPCVAWDTPCHRHLIHHGDTGFLCKSEEEMLMRIGQLVESAELRRNIGRAAKEEASLRFDPARFGQQILRAYQLPAAAA
jgi:glycosyltransferase involved in cell wall biosynthesis